MEREVSNGKPVFSRMTLCHILLLIFINDLEDVTTTNYLLGTKLVLEEENIPWG